VNSWLHFLVLLVASLHSDQNGSVSNKP
jgi:hypothetical protein